MKVTDSFSLSGNRSLAWLLGTAAGATASAEAGIVQIDLTGNGATFNGTSVVDHSNADITGDGIDDLVGSSSLSFQNAKGEGLAGRIAGVNVVASYRYFTSSSVPFTYFFAAIERNYSSNDAPVSVRDFVPVTFTDARINNGAPTQGYLEVSARCLAADSSEIRLVRLVFDDANVQITGMISVTTSFPAWMDPALQTGNNGNGNAAKLRLKRQIAALEAKIRKLKASARPNGLRLNFLRTNPATFRQIVALERKLAALKKALRRL